MITKGLRGAITVDENTENAIKIATLELLYELTKQNKIRKENISHIIFTVTDDLDAAFPAKFARQNLGYDDVAMMCFNEIPVKNSLRMCLRILIVLNCEEDYEPKFVYLKGAQDLRK